MVAFFIYFNGVNGFYLLDDTPNLRPLAEIKSPLTWQQIYNYVVMAGEIASPTLRPVSMFTFALQYGAWPLYPSYFKFVNIVIHLLNGGLIYLIARHIASLLGISSLSSRLMACWSAAFWLLHPINVSSVLYIIQRMALLSAFFTFASVWLFLLGRQRLQMGKPFGWLLINLAVMLTGSLALLSKENGALVPVLLLVVEVTIFSAYPIERETWKKWKLLFLWLPSSVIVGYLVFKGFAADEAQRPYTVLERSITQFRVLPDYLSKIFLPHPKSFGLYFDDYRKSTGWLNPASTLAGAVFIFSLIVSAIIYRKKYPIFAFAILWYFGAHLIESSTLLLELYFEHRNYCALMGVAVALPFLWVYLKPYALIKPILLLGGVVMLLLVAGVTAGEVRLWGSPVKQAILWGMEKPDSLRARSVMAAVFAMSGDRVRAYHEYRDAAVHFPDTAGPYTDIVLLHCYDVNIPLPKLDELLPALARSKFSFAPLNNFSMVVEEMERGKCSGVTSEYLIASINVLSKNSYYQSQKFKSSLYFMLSRVFAIKKDLGSTMAYAAMANETMPNIGVYLQQAEWYIAAGYYKDAVDSLIIAQQLAEKNYLKSQVYSEVIMKDRVALEKIMSRKQE